jgi:hypothetical protein
VPRRTLAVGDFSGLTRAGSPDNVSGSTGAIRFLSAVDATVPALIERQLEIP